MSLRGYDRKENLRANFLIIQGQLLDEIKVKINYFKRIREFKHLKVRDIEFMSQSLMDLIIIDIYKLFSPSPLGNDHLSLKETYKEFTEIEYTEAGLQNIFSIYNDNESRFKRILNQRNTLIAHTDINIEKGFLSKKMSPKYAETVANELNSVFNNIDKSDYIKHLQKSNMISDKPEEQRYRMIDFIDDLDFIENAIHHFTTVQQNLYNIFKKNLGEEFKDCI